MNERKKYFLINRISQWVRPSQHTHTHTHNYKNNNSGHSTNTHLHHCAPSVDFLLLVCSCSQSKSIHNAVNSLNFDLPHRNNYFHFVVFIQQRVCVCVCVGLHASMNLRVELSIWYLKKKKKKFQTSSSAKACIGIGTHTHTHEHARNQSTTTTTTTSYRVHRPVAMNLYLFSNKSIFFSFFILHFRLTKLLLPSPCNLLIQIFHNYYYTRMRDIISIFTFSPPPSRSLSLSVAHTKYSLLVSVDAGIAGIYDCKNEMNTNIFVCIQTL